MRTNKAKCLELIDASTELEIAIEDRNKVNGNKILEIRKIEVMIRKILNSLRRVKKMN